MSKPSLHKGCTCTKCGWAHFGVTQAYAENAVKEFNAWYDTQPEAVQESYGGPASITTYQGCWCGGNDFRPTKEGDCPVGVTLSPVIWDQEGE